MQPPLARLTAAAMVPFNKPHIALDRARGGVAGTKSEKQNRDAPHHHENTRTG